MIFQLTAAELKTSDVLGCFFIARNAGVSSSVRRRKKMKGMIRQPMKNGILHPHWLKASGPSAVRVTAITASDTTMPSVGDVCSHPV